MLLQVLWEIRERGAEALRADGNMYTFDVSLPLENFYEGVGVLQELLKNNDHVVHINGFGHLGDGNIHLNVTSREFDAEFLHLIEEAIFKWTSKHRGSISAEHGIGFLKPAFLHYSKTPKEIELMKQFKNLLDPQGILNPYKFPLPKKRDTCMSEYPACDLCGRIFGSRNAMLRHRRTIHHGDLRSTDELNIRVGASIYPHPCRLCMKKFPTRAIKLAHIAKEHAEKNRKRSSDSSSSSDDDSDDDRPITYPCRVPGCEYVSDSARTTSKHRDRKHTEEEIETERATRPKEMRKKRVSKKKGPFKKPPPKEPPPKKPPPKKRPKKD